MCIPWSFQTPKTSHLITLNKESVWNEHLLWLWLVAVADPAGTGGSETTSLATLTSCYLGNIAASLFLFNVFN